LSIELASLFHRFLFDFLAFAFRLLGSAKVDISWRQVVERFVAAFMIVVADELRDRLLQVPWEEERFQLDDILRRAMIPFNLAPGHRVVRRTSNMGELSPSGIWSEYGIQSRGHCLTTAGAGA